MPGGEITSIVKQSAKQCQVMFRLVKGTKDNAGNMLVSFTIQGAR